MLYFLAALTALCSTTVLSNIDIRRAGWLDRVVAYQKNKFFEDLKKIPNVQIKARIEHAPPGYVDSRDWNYESVIRLLTLIRESDGAKPVMRAIRRSMKSSRRYIMNFADTFKAFPSLAKQQQMNLAYDVDMGEYYADVQKSTEIETLEDEDIIVVSNPVEAKLPSARISVQLLRSILENRAEAGRYVSSTKKAIPWPSTKQKNGKGLTKDIVKETSQDSTTIDSSGNVSITTVSPTSVQTNVSETTKA